MSSQPNILPRCQPIITTSCNDTPSGVKDRESAACEFSLGSLEDRGTIKQAGENYYCKCMNTQTTID